VTPRVHHSAVAEYRAIDPEGNWFDLSGHGFLPPQHEQA
jgi:hypothetical protein